MKNRVSYARSKLARALKQLEIGVAAAKDRLDHDGVIQRFEFTFELLWKTLKIFLEDKGIETKSPKDALKEAFRMGLLVEEGVYLDMLKDRNKTSHIYDKEEANKIFRRIKKKYLPRMKSLLANL
jgi:nucleotidyltransferase substrate binding protein (TIGR01987 family)